jgi:hypothetical protein
MDESLCSIISKKASKKEKATVSRKQGKRDQTWAKRPYFGSLDR